MISAATMFDSYSGFVDSSPATFFFTGEIDRMVSSM